jgi:hypothetical protein
MTLLTAAVWQVPMPTSEPVARSQVFTKPSDPPVVNQVPSPAEMQVISPSCALGMDRTGVGVRMSLTVMERSWPPVSTVTWSGKQVNALSLVVIRHVARQVCDRMSLSIKKEERRTIELRLLKIRMILRHPPSCVHPSSPSLQGRGPLHAPEAPAAVFGSSQHMRIIREHAEVGDCTSVDLQNQCATGTKGFSDFVG